MSVFARICFIKDIEKGQSVSYGRRFISKKKMKLATVSIGYSNGYLRALSNKSFVVVKDKRCPAVGTVTMDQIMVDVTDLTHPAQLGDEAVLIGLQEEERVSVKELAKAAGTNPWHVFTGISKRVPRHYC